VGMMPPKKLVIIDYCGTLSLEASRFGRPENLVRVLQESGLAALGVSTPEAFWNEIVDPTWVEGSTTAIGYTRVMADRIASRGFASAASPGEIEAAASRFVALYLESSRIDPHWRPVLARLCRHPAAITVVATDHYAEATETIAGYLDSWGISFFIANSADLGFWKQDRRFWEILKSQLAPASVRRILLIDDFGFNEAPGDSYGERAKVLARREKTVANIEESFRALVEGVPFELPGVDGGSDEAAALLIERTGAGIDAFLEGGQ